MSGSWKQVVLSAAAAVLLYGVGGPATAADTPGVTDTTITLGASNALTGPVANACKPVTDGTAAWFAKVNAEGGIKGRKVKLDLLDDAYDGTRAVANTRQFAREPVLAIISGCGTNSAVAIGPLANREGIPYIMPYAAHADLVEPTKPWIFAGLPLYDKQLAALVGWTFKRSGPGKVAMVAVQVPGIESWIAAAKKATEAGGGTFLEPQVSQSGQADFTPAVLRLKSEAPDYVIMAVAAGDGARLVETARVQQFAPKRSYLGYSTVSNSIFLHSVAADIEGKIFVTSPTVPETSAEAQAVCGDVFAKYAPEVKLWLLALGLHGRTGDDRGAERYRRSVDARCGEGRDGRAERGCSDASDAAADLHREEPHGDPLALHLRGQGRPIPCRRQGRDPGMTLFLAAVVSGLSVGLLYGLLGFSIVVLYRATGVVSFAQSSIAMFTTFVVYLLTQRLGLPILAAILLGGVIALVMAVVIYAATVRPNDDAGTLNLILRTFALYLLLFEVANTFWSVGQPFKFPKIFPDSSLDLWGVVLPVHSIGVLAVVIVLASGFYVLFMHTKIGLFLRAIADRPDVARMLGVGARPMTALAWVLAVEVCLVVGLLTAPSTLLSTTMMDSFMLFAFAGALLGGLRSWIGAFAGGAVVGVVTNVTTVYASSEVAVVVAFLLLLVGLIFKPEGFFGQPVLERF
jgi:branched-chain amino acid transport system permease protein